MVMVVLTKSKPSYHSSISLINLYFYRYSFFSGVKNIVNNIPWGNTEVSILSFILSISSIFQDIFFLHNLDFHLSKESDQLMFPIVSRSVRKLLILRCLQKLSGTWYWWCCWFEVGPDKGTYFWLVYWLPEKSKYFFL